MDTEAVRLFVLTAKLLNISAAGRQLGLSPAVAGARLARLEQQVGADLLHRSTRKVSLSLEGVEFLPFAREMLAQEDAAYAALGHGNSQPGGTIRFAASSTFAQRYIAPVLPEFLDQYPKINLELRFSDTQTNLIEGGYDLALRILPIKDSALIGRKLADDKRILCAAPSYLNAFGTPQSPDDLNDHRALAFADLKPRTLQADQKPAFVFPPAGTNPRLICDDGASIRLATQAGVGIAISSVWSIHKELKAGSLVPVLPEYQVNDGSAIWLVYPKSNVLTAKVRVLIDFLIEKIGSPPIWE